MPVGPITASLPVPPGVDAESRSRSATVSSMARRTTAPAPAVMAPTPKAVRKAPSLVKRPTWVIGDGSLKAIADTIDTGVPKPKNYPRPMPPKGGAPLSDSDVAAVAAYVWAISHRRR